MGINESRRRGRRRESGQRVKEGNQPNSASCNTGSSRRRIDLACI
jgi:hypothetical protein